MHICIYAYNIFTAFFFFFLLSFRAGTAGDAVAAAGEPRPRQLHIYIYIYMPRSAGVRATRKTSGRPLIADARDEETRPHTCHGSDRRAA